MIKRQAGEDEGQQRFKVVMDAPRTRQVVNSGVEERSLSQAPLPDMSLERLSTEWTRTRPGRCQVRYLGSVWQAEYTQ